jgi:hypothetical protein
MKINLSKKQYEILIRALDAGSSVYGILGDNVSEEYKKQSNEIEKLEEYLLGFAKEFGREDMTQEFHGKLIMSDGFSEELQETVDEYDNETFWQELEMRLGKRDFERTVTEAEKKEIEDNNGWLPERIHGLYEKWGKEFEDYGIERLEVMKK